MAKIKFDPRKMDDDHFAPVEKGSKKTKFRDSSPHVKDKRAPKKNNSFKRTKI